MKARLVPMAAAGVAFLVFAGAGAPAQEAAPPPPPQVQAAAQFSQAQLDQMLAPLALYPDSLVGQILIAATYPLEVVEADRWLQDPNNAALKGDQLTAALEQQDWDPSVKSLVPFPQILHMMDGNLQWTEQLGEAFMGDQASVTDSIQRLRQRAQAAGKLRSSPQETIGTDGPAITIEPPTPETVYVPVYDPSVVYGPWPYPDYPPYYFPDYFGDVYIGGFGFGWLGVGIVAPFWGWDHWDWAHRRIDIDPGRWGRINHGRPPALGNGGGWQHDPSHRDGVPYRQPAVRNRFAGTGTTPEAHRDFRGYPTGGTLGSRPPTGGGAPETRHFAVPATPRVPPSFESFGRGADVRAEAQRGYSSRMSMPSFHPSGGGGQPSGGGGRPSGGGGGGRGHR